ncbi:MAG TPA: hypothetical protein VEY88_04025 [Archangium sp.]|nr:hypothetical protein [Archangium sp.]
MNELQLRVAIWGGQTPSGNMFGSGKLDLTQRITELETVLLKARKWLDVTGGGTLPVLKIFVAPEYLLIKSSTNQEEEKAVSFDDFKLSTAEGKLRQLSQGLLFIPGTVVWKKPALKYPEPNNGGIPIDRVEKLKSKAHRYNTRLENYDLKMSGRVTYGAEQDMETFKNRLGKIEKFDRSNAYIARNAAYVYYDGDMVLKYYKQSEYRGKKFNGKGLSYELGNKDRQLHPKGIKFVPGYKEGVFQVEVQSGLFVHCGVEICADHSGQQLKHSITRKALHLHFILSDQVSNLERSVAVEPGGYVVHASTSSSSSGVFDHTLKKLPEASTEDVKYGRLTCYTQTLAL